MIAGIDFSINGTGMSFSDNSFHFHTKLKRLPKKINHPKITAYTVEPPKKNDNTIRYYLNAKDIVQKCIEKNVEVVGIEGYAYGYAYSAENPGLVFDIAESCGMVKALLAQQNIKIHIFPPSQIKKNGSGRGDASKVRMVESFLLEPNIEPIQYLIKEFDLNKYSSPINDLVDSYFCMKLLKKTIESGGGGADSMVGN